MKSIKIVIVFFMLFTVGCSTMTASEHRVPRGEYDSSEYALTPLDYSQYGKPPVPVKILLLIPAEFEHFELTSHSQSGGNLYLLGRDAEQELRKAFGIEFATVEIWHVRSENRATEMLAPNDPETVQMSGYDYVAIPKCLRVKSLEGTGKYGFEIDLQVDFNAKNGSSITITSHGETMIEMYAEISRENGAVQTLKYAVSALLDRIEKRRGLFVSLWTGA